MTLYKMKFVDGATLRAELSEEEWFKVFLSGTYRDGPLEYIERADAADKKVTFEENSRGSESRKLA